MINKKRMGLGRGLGALLPEKQMEEEDAQSVETYEISVDGIETNPYQPRTNFDSEALNELKESIQVQGIIQPITVRRIGNVYQLISGERRLQASKLAGLSKIPAYIREATDQQMLEMGLIENIQRENLNPMEVALAYQRLLKECNIKQDELGSRVGKDRTTVNNYLRLLNLPEIIQTGLAEKKLSMGHARALLGIENEEVLLNTYREIIQKEYSVRKVEDLVREINAGAKPKKSTESSTSKSPKIVLEELQVRLSALFSKKVAVVADAKSKGEIKIPFGSKEELEEIIGKLKK
ncbi:ParB/RepB/Spo0J family partition protein [Lacihabitans soyangensis]|uniref:ParB/RepB/Spo0J family partition protein n=1 Tax=Lacihabitans soyangensis TaxID=869394 RepID=A0AAE3KV83_9BACT|nr:ParB/RepB/Spo0J family partition protein [Lacihabitans soyangensis]MCP9763926.1 ParB/RepB/Spo0J family partition protein [Lacihabitans soyangensis]